MHLCQLNISVIGTCNIILAGSIWNRFLPFTERVHGCWCSLKRRLPVEGKRHTDRQNWKICRIQEVTVSSHTEWHRMPTCSCESSWCHKGEQKARWRRPPDNCCPVGSRLSTWPQPADRRTLSGRSVPPSAYCSPGDHTVCSDKHNARSSSPSDIWGAMSAPPGIWPDGAVLRRAPESVGPHGRCGDAFDSVGVVRKHMDGFFHRQIVHVHLRVRCTCHQNSVSRVRKEL